MTLQRRIEKLEQRGPDAGAIRQGVQAWRETGQIPSDLPERVREHVERIAALVQAAESQFENLDEDG